MSHRQRSGYSTRRALALWIGVLIGVVTGAVLAALLIWPGDDDPPTTQALSSTTTAAPSTPGTTKAPTTLATVATSSTSPATTQVSTTTTIAPTTTTEPVDQALETMAGMSDADKVAQLFVVEVFGTSADDDSRAAENQAQFGPGVSTPAQVIETWKVGGVIYFAANVDNPLQVAEFSQGLQNAARDAGMPGLLIAADQEGGRVVRIRDGATVFPPALIFGSIDDPELTRQAANATGVELRAMGINQVYAPVADVVTNPGNQVIGDRSYGAEAEVVSAHTAAAVAGFEGTGVAATAKHWPGHGDTATDSHLRLAEIDVDADTWIARDVAPFRRAIEAGVSAVMVGQIEIEAFGDNGPATLDGSMIERLRALGFENGVVVTDSLRMGGVRNTGLSDGEIAVRAINAGIDMLLLPFDPVEAFTAVNQAVADGTITAERLDEAVIRILRLKAKLGALAPPVVAVNTVPTVVGSDQNQALLQEVLRRADALGLG